MTAISMTSRNRQFRRLCRDPLDLPLISFLDPPALEKLLPWWKPSNRLEVYLFCLFVGLFLFFSQAPLFYGFHTKGREGFGGEGDRFRNCEVNNNNNNNNNFICISLSNSCYREFDEIVVNLLVYFKIYNDK